MRKQLYKALTAITASCLLLTAAGSVAAATRMEEEQKAETPAAEDAQQEWKIIGTEAEGENIFSVRLTNDTEKDIIALSVKGMNDEDYPDSLLEEEDVFGSGETRLLYYDATEVVEAAEEENSVEENRPIVTPGYMVQVTFADDTVQELHTFPFGDAEEVTFCEGEEVLYVTYTSLLTEEEVSTEESELMAKEREEMTVEAEQIYYEPSQIVYEVPVYQEPEQTAPAESYEEPAPVEIYEEPAPVETYVEPAPVEVYDDTCISDGLTY